MKTKEEMLELYRRAREAYPGLPEPPSCPRCGQVMQPGVCLDAQEWTGHYWECDECSEFSEAGFGWPFDDEFATFEDWERLGIRPTAC